MDTYRCELCNLNMRSKEFLVGHLQGKSHHKLAAKLDALNDLAARSVYISGFKSQPSTETVQLALNQFGPVERVIVDRKAGKFAIVEFSNSKPVDLLLHQKSMVIGHDTVQLKKRRVDFDQSNGYNNNDEELISRERLLELLNDCETGNLLRDVQSLISAFRISDVKIEERVEFVSRLSDYVQTFFQTSIKIQIFGSTVTGFGLADADLDLCFSIERSESNGNCGLELLSKTVEDLRHSRISAHDFYSIQRSGNIPVLFRAHCFLEQVRLLTRILNEFRKETSTINYLTAVPDARCPVIRFVALEDVHCELSTRNVLGMYKSNFVQKALGNGELAHLLFVIRLWARCFNFFRDPNEPMGHWSSYSISLIFLAFCQKQGLISALKLEDEKKDR
ncbi:RRM domain-containing protein [Aphelenchoides besseyi]|nr:RRM domain-containing protein [Aphelenchoides besseyi]